MKRFLVVATAAATTFLSLGLASVATSAVASGSLPNPGGARMIKVSSHAGPQTVSLNWSGYAVTSTRQFNYVHVRFVQPTATCSGKPLQWSSNWSGLDGFNNGTVEQDGTFMTCGRTGNTPQYFAWYEMFPAGSVVVFKVKPGDVIDSSVRFANGMFTLKIGDITSDKWATKTATCSQCARASAEWIVERPAVCSSSSCTHGLLTALANFGLATMSGAKATVQGGTARGIASFTNNYPIDMVQPLKKGGFISLDEVSPVDTSNQSFQVLWERSGTPIPITF